MEWFRGQVTDSNALARNVVILACAVDAADKGLLPATFTALDRQLHLGPSKLAALAFAQGAAFSLALPFWGSLMRYYSARDLLVFGCVAWAVTTLALSMATTFELQFALRIVVGAALASVNPLGQAMLCDVVPEAERGAAFGMLQSISAGLSMFVAFAATSTASMDFGSLKGWQLAHVLMALASFLVGIAVYRFVESKPPLRLPPGTTWLSEQRRVVRAVGGKPTFYIMVGQGVFGGIPWSGLAFAAFYFTLCGYSDFQAGQILLLGGMGAVLGGYIGGVLGDYFGAAHRLGPAGRCAVAQTSVVLGIFAFMWMICIPHAPSSFHHVVLACFVFHFVACWTPAAALRPICGEIFRSSHDRAQVLALWITLEGLVSSICGAPLVGLLSEAFGYRLSTTGPSSSSASASPELRAQNRDALRLALIGVSLLPWTLCAIAWLPMYWTYPKDREQAILEAEKADSVDVALRQENGDAKAASAAGPSQPLVKSAANGPAVPSYGASATTAARRGASGQGPAVPS